MDVFQGSFLNTIVHFEHHCFYFNLENFRIGIFHLLGTQNFLKNVHLHIRLFRKILRAYWMNDPIFPLENFIVNDDSY